MVSVISPICAKVRPYVSFSIGYSAGTSDWIMSLRKCEKLSARMIEKVAASAVRCVVMAGSETLVVIACSRYPGAAGPGGTINPERQILDFLPAAFGDGSYSVAAGAESRRAATDLIRFGGCTGLL